MQTSTGSMPEAGQHPTASPDWGTVSGARETHDQGVPLIEEAKQAVHSKLESGRESAAGGFGSLADALRDAARRRRSDGQDDAFAGFTASAADGLDRLSGTLRQKDVGAMLQDMDRFARAQPLACFGLAVAAGFLAVRFIKASND